MSVFVQNTKSSLPFEAVRSLQIDNTFERHIMRVIANLQPETANEDWFKKCFSWLYQIVQTTMSAMHSIFTTSLTTVWLLVEEL